jgi:hypothetical protein
MMYQMGQQGNAPPQGAQVNVIASCPANQFALGGGVVVLQASGGPPVLMQSAPVSTSTRPNGWRVVMNVGAGPYNVQSQVICGS